MIKNLVFSMVFCLCFCATYVPAIASDDLEDIMKANGRNYSAIEKGIKKGKFEGLPAKAQDIASSATKIKSFEPPINKEQKGSFDALADQLQADAQELKAVLQEARTSSGLASLKQMEQTCAACHRAFIPKKKK